MTAAIKGVYQQRIYMDTNLMIDRGNSFPKGIILTAVIRIIRSIGFSVDWQMIDIWKTITEKYAGDIFIGLFLEAMNRGICLAPNMMQKLSSRGIKLGFDIYSF